MTPAEAARKLDELALDAENENYHSLAKILWKLVPEVLAITERTVLLIPLEYSGVERIEVEPMAEEVGRGRILGLAPDPSADYLPENR